MSWKLSPKGNKSKDILAQSLSIKGVETTNKHAFFKKTKIKILLNSTYERLPSPNQSFFLIILFLIKPLLAVLILRSPQGVCVLQKLLFLLTAAIGQAAFQYMQRKSKGWVQANPL